MTTTTHPNQVQRQAAVTACGKVSVKKAANDSADRQKSRLEARFANSPAMVAEAQRLRADIFGDEYGVVFDRADGLDVDAYDAYCIHLNVYDAATDRIIATTRLLTDEQARAAGGFYSSQEFDLTALTGLAGRTLEVGRTCVHPDYR